MLIDTKKRLINTATRCGLLLALTLRNMSAQPTNAEINPNTMPYEERYSILSTWTKDQLIHATITNLSVIWAQDEALNELDLSYHQMTNAYAKQALEASYSLKIAILEEREKRQKAVLIATLTTGLGVIAALVGIRLYLQR